jgi:3-hydroxyacyl-CoA dehydrogenase / 3-hydroxy-2-methylbutyryl-CoA dehydrogenase
LQKGIAATMESFGAIHICCNYAGIGNAIKTVGKDGAFPLDKFKLIIDVNLIGTFNVLRLAANEMQKNEPFNEYGGRGCIINTASVAAYEGQIGQAAYSASKGGIVGMTLPIARDLSSIGVRCNTIVPGLIHTPLFQGAPGQGHRRAGGAGALSQAARARRRDRPRRRDADRERVHERRVHPHGRRHSHAAALTAALAPHA